MSVANLLADLSDARSLLKDALVTRGYVLPAHMQLERTTPHERHKSTYSPQLRFTPSLPHLPASQRLQHQKDLREKRTLRSKVFRILETVGAECHRHQHKVARLTLCEKKKLPTNRLTWRAAQSQDTTSSMPSPRDILKRSLSTREFAVLSDDPMYFVINSKYKHKLKSLIERSWDELLDEESDHKRRLRLPNLKRHL
jgi:hypothetical protein